MDAVKLRGQRRIDGVGKHRLALDRLNPDQQAISSATLSEGNRLHGQATEKSPRGVKMSCPTRHNPL
jgi:hypothetical protein